MKPTHGHRLQDLNRQIALGMKPKKLHEVSHFASLVADLGSKADIHRAIDIGAGQGVSTSTLVSIHLLVTRACTDEDDSI
jgi:hypothetical protein